MTWEQQLRQALILVASVAVALMALGLVVLLGAGLLHLPTALNRAGNVVPTIGLALLLSAGIAALGAFVVAAVLARLLARTLSHRLNPLIAWSRDIGRPAGDVGLPTTRADELGELRYALEQAHQQLRTLAIGRETFLAAVAHDLRTLSRASTANWRP